MASKTYRPDIDGLRTVAVLSVLFFHVEFTSFSGGYVGVDIFFVISGFLITRLIRDEFVSTGSFNFLNFYLRRARRLFPALLVTVLVSFLAGIVLLSPDHLQRMGGSTIHALLSLSNMYFWAEADYFDTAKEFKPLLHTWSLSVEEQYYLLWPAFLLLLLKRGRLWIGFGLAAAFAVSFFLNYVFYDGESSILSRLSPTVATWFSDGGATIFFLTPFRVFEFAIGAALVWCERRETINPILQELLLLLGFVLIAYAVFTFDDNTIFPAWNALIPCLGAALAIYAGRARYLGLLLRNRLSVQIGLISYSLYLVHWPLIVFYKYRTFGSLGLIEQVSICLAAFAMAFLMYRYVEQPFRRARPGARHLSPAGFGLACVASALLLCFPAASVWANQGWAWRASNNLAFDMGTIRAEREAAIRAPMCHMNKKGQSFSDFIEGFDQCNALGSRNLLVLGDSHAAEIYVALASQEETFDGVQLLQLTGAGCNLTNHDVKACNELMDFALNLVTQESDREWIIAYADNLDHLVNRIQHNNGPAHLDLIKRRIDAFTEAGAEFNWISRPQFEDPQKALSVAFDLSDYQRRQAATLRRQHMAAASEIEKAMQHNDKFHLIKISDYLCEANECRVVSPKTDRYLYWDYGHFTVYGSQYVGPFLVAGLFNESM